MRGELFKGIKQWNFEQAGRMFKLPVFYYDNTSLTAIYTASTGKVRKLLPHPAMKPIEMFPGRCMVAFTAFEYRKTDIDPYNEFSIAFLITFAKPRIPGLTALWQLARRCFTAYVWKLPVTTEIARFGGVELYGYPKFLADITFEKKKEWIECHLSEKGEKILALKGKILPATRGKITRFVTYSIVEEIPVTANVVVNPLEFAQSRDSQSASLELGPTHPIAEALREIGLGSRPIVYQFSPVTEAVLFGGRNVMDR
jgi:Acetoacetate decarboxylase (ADC)